MTDGKPTPPSAGNGGTPADSTTVTCPNKNSLPPREISTIEMKRKNIDIGAEDKYGHWWFEMDGTESYDTCAHRELWEELGITALLYKLFKLDACPELGMEFIQAYRCMYNGPLKLEPAEIDEGAWYSLKDINTIVDKNDPQFTDTFKIIWRNFRLIGSM